MDTSLPKNWIVIICPVCKKRLGTKTKNELASFICMSDGCSETEHFFYPGQTVLPGKSIPWAVYKAEKQRCGKACCDPEDED